MNYTAEPAWTIQGNKHTIDQLNEGYTDSSPGPMYNTFSMGIKTRCVSFSQSKYRRTKINEAVIPTPSPDKYHPNKPALVDHPTSFARSQRVSEQLKNQNPDPNMYRPNNDFGKEKAPDFSMGSKYPSIMDNTGNNPGPGDYNNPEAFPTSKFNTKKSKFTTDKRFSQPNLHKPGVGDYNISKSLLSKNKGTTTKAERFIEARNLPPPPGTYEHNSDFDETGNKGKTIGKVLPGMFVENVDTANAFGVRDDPHYKTNGPFFSVGKEKREIFECEKIPAPTDYFPNKTQKNSAHAVFPKSSYPEYNEVKQNPGPGHYPDQMMRSTMYTIPKSKSVNYLNRNPGAGRYEVDPAMGKIRQKFKNQTSGPLFSKSNRTNFISKNIAGVGDYDLLKKKTGGISIPKAERFGKSNKNPGPGDYHMQTTISNFTFYRKK